jgi:hypothetical protein
MKIKAPTMEELIEQWEKDSAIDQTEPGKEIIRIPLLHSKYNKYLSLHNLSTKKASSDINKMKKLKWLYYTGKMDQEQLQELGWEPFKFTLKSDISVYIDGDEDLAKLNQRKQYHEEASSFCINVMKEINARTYQLRAFIEWERFIQGGR